jgi:hypothetical protein
MKPLPPRKTEPSYKHLKTKEAKLPGLSQQLSLVQSSNGAGEDSAKSRPEKEKKLARKRTRQISIHQSKKVIDLKTLEPITEANTLNNTADQLSGERVRHLSPTNFEARKFSKQT